MFLAAAGFSAWPEWARAEGGALSRALLFADYGAVLPWLLAIATVFFALSLGMWLHWLAMRRKVEGEVARSRALLESVPDAIFVVEEQGRVVDVNQAAVAKYGYTRAEMLAMRASDFNVPERLEWVRQTRERIYDRGDFSFESLHVDKLGDVFPVEVNAKVARIGGRDLEIAVVRDLRQRRKVERRAALLAAIVDSAEDAIVGTDATGRVLSWNAGAERLYGWTAEEAVGREIGFVLPLEEADRARERLRRVLRSGRSMRYETKRRRRDGREVDVMVTLGLMRDINTGGTLGLSAIVRDLTERNKLISQLRGKVAELQRSNKELEDFAFIASHDLQEPLRKISSYSGLLVEEAGTELGDDAKTYLDVVCRAAMRMSDLVDGLLELSRVTTRGREFERLDLGEVVHDALDSLEVRIRETEASIKVEGLPEITGDRDQMRRLLENLVSNSLKYRHPERRPEIDIRAEESEETVSLVVSDNGTGFEEKHADSIFKPFSRLVGRSDQDGSGIGLAISRKIVTRHGGRLTAHGKPGEGARFRIDLPVNNKAEAS